jgi:hypothetical protein
VISSAALISMISISKHEDRQKENGGRISERHGKEKNVSALKVWRQCLLVNGLGFLLLFGNPI